MSDSRLSAKQRAALSLGESSSKAIYQMVRRMLAHHTANLSTLVDIGCGQGNLYAWVQSLCQQYIGVDALRYPDYPAHLPWRAGDLNHPPIALASGLAQAVVCVETIEHVENPRALMRELKRLTCPGGWIIVTTPNQLSFLSLLTLLLKQQFNAFQEAEGLYPAHITALLEIDLRRIAQECNLEVLAIAYSDQGRIPFTPWHWPPFFRGRWFSDNLCLVARHPVGCPVAESNENP